MNRAEAQEQLMLGADEWITHPNWNGHRVHRVESGLIFREGDRHTAKHYNPFYQVSPSHGYEIWKAEPAEEPSVEPDTTVEPPKFDLVDDYRGRPAEEPSETTCTICGKPVSEEAVEAMTVLCRDCTSDNVIHPDDVQEPAESGNDE